MRAEHCNIFVNTLMSCALGLNGHVTFCTTLRLSAALLWKLTYIQVGEVKQLQPIMFCIDSRRK